MAQNQIQHHVFIGGCSRSGTTLLGAMLGTHGRCICAPESHFKIEILRRLPQLHDIDLPTAVADTIKHWRFKIWDMLVETEQICEEADGRSYGDMLNWLVTQYAVSVDRSQADIWVDHTPENICYAATLNDIYPDAKYIHIVRDGRAVAASILPLDWGPNTTIKAARWWVRKVSFGLAAESFLRPSHVMRVRYEDLVAQPEPTLRALCRFLDIEYQPEMPQATGFQPPRYTSRQHKQVGQSPNRQTSSRWRSQLSPRDVEIFEHLTRNFLDYLGYETVYGLQTKPPSFAELQLGKAAELWRGEILNKFKWLVRSYPLWLSRDFYAFARLSDTNN